jgi:DNA-directed RNA polymerase specialized sigma24 family protein
MEGAPPMDRREQIQTYFREIEAPLRRALSRFQLSAAELNDLVQDAVARVLTTKTDVTFSSSWELLAYLNKAAASVHLDAIRKTKARGHEEQLLETDVEWKPSVGIDEVLSDWLGKLSEDERRVAELRLERKTWDEVAAALGHASSSQSRRLFASALASLGMAPRRTPPVASDESDVLRELEGSASVDYYDVRAAGWDEADEWWRIVEGTHRARRSQQLAALRGLLVFTGFHPNVGSATCREAAQRFVELRQSVSLPASGWDDLAVTDIVTLGYAGRVDDARALALLLMRRAARTNAQELLALTRDVIDHYGLWPDALSDIGHLLALYCDAADRPDPRWLRLAARVALSRTSLDAAIRFAREASECRRPAHTLVVLADACTTMGDYGAALDALSRLERCFEYPEDWILARRAAVEFRLGNTDAGRFFLARAVWIHRTYPTSAGARWIGECYALLGRDRDARMAFRRALRLHDEGDDEMRPTWEVLLDEVDIIRTLLPPSTNRRDFETAALEVRLERISERLGL